MQELQSGRFLRGLRVAPKHTDNSIAEPIAGLRFSDSMVKLGTGGWGVDVNKAHAFTAVSSGAVPLPARDRVLPNNSEDGERWPGWFRLSFILGANAVLWTLILRAFF